MNEITIAHASDIHYCEKHLEWVDKAMTTFVDGAIASHAVCAILSGDSFDHQLHTHDPAVHAFLRQIRKLADHMPVLILQGTFSHDRPGSLDLLRTLGGRHPVHVADRISQVMLVGGAWKASEGYRFEGDITGPLGDVPKVLVSCLPSIHKGQIKAITDGEGNAAELIEQVCHGWAEANLKARVADIPTVLTAHGTVVGSLTESHFQMVSPDHEFSPGALFASQAAAVMVGHIHAHNSWEFEGRRIAYPGSLTRLVHGHHDKTYWLKWSVGSSGSSFDCIETPARMLIDIAFNGAPDLMKLQEAATQCDGAYVRVRWSVDEEHAHTVDRKAILDILSGACEVKLEGRVNPIQRSRAEGLNRAETLVDKLEIWGTSTATSTGPLVDRLHDLELMEADEIIEKYCDEDTEVQTNAAA